MEFTARFAVDAEAIGLKSVEVFSSGRQIRKLLRRRWAFERGRSNAQVEWRNAGALLW